ncbi:MAG: hypothetical protein DHS20C20_00080 [Ardenticatenaceae bacterium]|nr:MAG: hypothetical protein DHS20C20_00080 [Ardenticatenaceae bacterium]
MALQIKHSFTIETPIDLVWNYFADPAQVVPCLPGAELVEVIDEQAYLGRVGIRLGQINMNLEGQVRILEVDPQQKVMKLTANGDQLGASGGADADISFSLSEVDKTHTEINILSDVRVSGKLAQMGGSMVQTVAKFMFGRFSKCIEKTLCEPTASEDIKAEMGFFRKVLAAIKNWFRRLFR